MSLLLWCGIALLAAIVLALGLGSWMLLAYRNGLDEDCGH